MNAAEALLLTLFLSHMFHLGISDQGNELKVGFYSETCPNAESIVKSGVRELTANSPRMPPKLVRLHFHDCFVEGCDGSILIDGSAVPHEPERNARGHLGVDGFDGINAIKRVLEAECPGVVSCADIVAMAARDSMAMVGGPSYDVETGRRDGRVSDERLADDMPEVDDSIDTLKAKFRSKGLSAKELVLLSGSHTFGRVACVFMQKRLYNFTGHFNFDDTDPAIEPDFASLLKEQCPLLGEPGVLIPLDAMTNNKFDDQVYRNIRSGMATISSDARLYDDETTRRVVDSYIKTPSEGRKNVPSFPRDFAKAMVKMGRIGVKTGSDGEIRRDCSFFN